MPDTIRQQLLDRLAAFGQQHLLGHWDKLSELERRSLATQIEALDLPLIHRLINSGEEGPYYRELAQRAEPPSVALLEGGGEHSPADFRRRGEEALAAGELGMILVAGGMGSRLGFDRPKGMFPLGPVSGRSLFQILIERLLAVSRRYGASIPLFVMTSSATHAATESFLAEHGRFGLDPENCRLFRQGEMPAADAQTGMLLLASPGKLFMGPDGHGGMLAALSGSGCLAAAEERGVRHFFYGQIDNPLLPICDPLLLGRHLSADAEVTTVVIRKQEAEEKMGLLATVDGRSRIIEYSDLPADVAGRREADGGLRLWAGSIAIHVFAASFLRRMASQSEALPFHRALKKVEHVDERGELVTPQRPNALKFERFIFDLLPQARCVLAVEGDPRRIYAPVKNNDRQGRECPATARAAMIARDRALLAAAGVEIAENVPVEISPLLALDETELRRRIELPLRLDEPAYLE